MGAEMRDDYWRRHAQRVAKEQGISMQEFLRRVDEGGDIDE